MSEPDDEPLAYLLFQAMSALRPPLLEALGSFGLGPPEFVCLRILNANPGRTGAELARDKNVSAQAMNQVLNRLQNLGAITRPATASSGRALPARLTREGKALLKRVEAAVKAAEEQMLDGLTSADQRELKRILRNFVNPTPR